jgi:hypothetical protein
MALDVATRLHHLRGDLGDTGPPEREDPALFDPFVGRPLGWAREGPRVRIDVTRAATPFELTLGPAS